MKRERSCGRLLLALWCASAGCAEARLEGDALSEETDAWGGMRSSALARSATGDFAIAASDDADPEEPTEDDADAEPASPLAESEEGALVDDDGVARSLDEGEDDPDALEVAGGLLRSAGAADEGAEPVLDEGPELLPQAAHATAGARGRRHWFVTPAGSPIFLHGVNTAWSSRNALHIGPYLATHRPEGEWRRLSSREGWGMNWMGGWQTETNPLVAAPGSRVPYGAVLTLTPRERLHEGGDPARPVATTEEGRPFAARGHWLQDPRQPGGRGIFCGGIGRTPYGDPFNPEYQHEVARTLERQVAVHRGRANLVLYYLGNEAGIGDRTRERNPRGLRPDAPYCAPGNGLVDLRRFLWTQCPRFSSIDRPFCAPHALGFFLRDRYGTIAALEGAWGTRYGSFEALLAARPEPDGGARGDDLADFALILVRQHVRVATEAIRRSDTQDADGRVLRSRARPIASPRLALFNDRLFHFYSFGHRPDRWASGGEVPDPHARRAGAWVNTARYPVLDPSRVRFDPYRAFGRFPSEPDAGFDVVAVNLYTGAARFPARWLHTGFGRLRAVTRLPVLVSEFGLRLEDSCWSNSGGAHAFVGPRAAYHEGDPRDVIRGERYQSQVRQFIHEGAIGVAWHRWVDDERPAPPNGASLAACGGRPRRNGQRKGLLRGDGQRYEGLFRGVHGFAGALYNNVRSARSWWQ